ncbi:MAG: hypothetical protein R3351_00740 [Nitrospirales bacterium]|nr:hypothetical protein [Nitrospirales bacterium]
MNSRVRTITLFLPTIVFLSVGVGASPTVDELPDITGAVIPVLTYDPKSSTTSGGELFSGGSLSQRGDLRYLVRVRNQSGDPIEADSLILVVQKIQSMSQLRDVTDPSACGFFCGQIDILGADGETEDGKAYFHVPMGGNTELEPYGESETIVIEIKNPNRVRLYPPVLRVRGVRRTASQDYQDALQDSLDEEVRPPPETPQSLYHLQALLDH